MTTRRMSFFAWMLFAAWPFALAQGAPAKQVPLSKAQKEFVSTCAEAFEKSGGSEMSELGHRICECTVQESRLEHVTQAALKRETDRIRKDHKYQVEDPGLLAAFQNCSIDWLREQK